MLRPTRIRGKSMNEKSYEQEQVERMIHILSQPRQGTRVHHWLRGCWEMNGNVDYAIVVNPTNQTTVVYSTNKNAKTDVPNLIGSIVFSLKVLEELRDNGCIVLYNLQTPQPITLGNSDLVGYAQEFRIADNILWKYMNMEIVTTNKLSLYIERDYQTFSEYTTNENLRLTRESCHATQESLKTAQDTLQASKCSICIAIITMILSIITSILCRIL